MSQYNWKTTTIKPTLQAYHTDGSYEAFVAAAQSVIPQMIKDGKTNGWTDVHVDYENEQTLIYRYWDTEDNAKAWKEYVESQTYNGMKITVTITYVG